MDLVMEQWKYIYNRCFRYATGMSRYNEDAAYKSIILCNTRSKKRVFVNADLSRDSFRIVGHSTLICFDTKIQLEVICSLFGIGSIIGIRDKPPSTKEKMTSIHDNSSLNFVVANKEADPNPTYKTERSGIEFISTIDKFDNVTLKIRPCYNKIAYQSPLQRDNYSFMMINTVSPLNINGESNAMMRRFFLYGPEKHVYQVVTVTCTCVIAKRKFPKLQEHILADLNVDEV
jgi:hypothetical protein